MSRKDRIEQSLQNEFHPVYLSVEDESSHHHVPKGAETHFKVLAVSERFNELSLVSRHRLVNQVLQGEFSQGLHALSLHLYTPKEWLNKKDSVLKSPSCKDGYKNKSV